MADIAVMGHGVVAVSYTHLGVSSLLRSLSHKFSREDKIEERDERNILVNWKTRTSAFRWTRLVLSLIHI